MKTSMCILLAALSLGVQFAHANVDGNCPFRLSNRVTDNRNTDQLRVASLMGEAGRRVNPDSSATTAAR